ncbi:MAG: OmpA family protein [Alphaproteobacteria bacterium]|nr:OmpA family protein [Alphaproteobacteria bacterium]
MRRAAGRTVTMLALLAAVALPVAAGANCREGAATLRAALAARDLEAARTGFEAVLAEPSCDDAFRDRAGRAVSALHARAAQERIAAGASLASQQRLLERGLGYGRAWPVLALLGDEAAARRDHDEAAALYQEALTVIDDEARTPRPPSVAEIERIFDGAARSRLLARAHRPAPRTRSGAPGGLGAERIRGFTVKRVPVPIGFHTDSDRFTERGQLAVAELAEDLMAQRPARIAIAGHTDPRGAAPYNLALSQRRAEAVGRYLREHGFRGGIDVVAKGESERFPVADPSAWTQEERWRMDRRVELIR